MDNGMENYIVKDEGVNLVHNRRWISLIIVLVSAFMDLLDTSIVGLAIPVIKREIGASYALMQWVLAAYSLAFALLLITGGRLGDIFGRKRIFIIGVAGFTLASAMCGFSQNSVMLITSRVIQGGMAALMVPQVLAIIQTTFPPKERGIVYGIYGGVVGLATVSGPLIGGFLTQGNLFNLGWRAIFLINLPVGTFALIAAIIFIQDLKSSKTVQLDMIGMIIVTVGLLLIVYPLIQGGELGWPIWTFVSMLLSIPVFAAFVRYEQYISDKKGSPLVVISLFKQKAFLFGLLVNLCIFAGVSAFFFVFAVYLQSGLEFSILSAGLACLPWSISVAIASGPAVQLVRKFGRIILHIGTSILAIGMAGMIVVIHQNASGISAWYIAPCLALSGLGMGLVAPVLTNIIIAGVKHSEVGSASGVLNTITQLGGAIGVALIGVIFFGVLTTQANVSIEQVIPQIQTDFVAAKVPEQYQKQIIDEFKVSFLQGITARDNLSTIPGFQQKNGENSKGILTTETEKQVRETLSIAANKARKLDFSKAMKFSLVYEVSVFFIAFMLIVLLPRKSVEV